MKVVAFLFIISYLEFVSGQADWTYNNQGAWTGDCSTGKAQSPIEINPFTTDMDKKSYMPFSFYGYDQTPKESKLMTTKNFVKAVFDFDKKPMIKGGGLLGNYKLDEIHFHFGNSEHTFKNYDGNNLKFLMEIHLIHVKENFDNMAKALEDSSSDKDKIAILSVMVRNQNSDNTMIKNLVDALVDVKTENTSKTFTGVKLEDLLPRNTDGFYRYNGSLTYPSCKETVVWTVFKNPLYLSQAQGLKFTAVTFVQNNFRSILKPLEGRKVFDVETSKKDYSHGNVLGASLLLLSVNLMAFFL